MIKSFTAVTREIDAPELAVSDILQALNLEKNLLKNSLGIVTCFSEFKDTGVLKAVCEALPFDCVGTTTCLCSSANDVDQLMLAIIVLTSDDCDFKTISIPLDEKYDNTIKNSLANFLNNSKETPAFILSYFPLINTISGDMILDAIDKTTGGIPLFGTSALDHTTDYSTATTIYNGKAERQNLVLAAIYGNPKVSFEIGSLNENKIRSQKAIITESDGNILIGINGKTALDYLEELGLTRMELETGLGILPLIVDHKDGTKPVARAVFTLTPNGHAVCGGAMPKNTTISIGRIERDDVIITTENTLKNLIEKDNALISYSCMARYLALGADSTAEADKVKEMASSVPYLFACSGGEICPLPDANGKLRNFFHNYTMAICKIC